MGTRYVANELAGTHQAATRAQQDAQLRELRPTPPPTLTNRPGSAPRRSRPPASPRPLQARAAELTKLDDARSRWLAHTAGTRSAAERAKAELAARHADDEPE